MQPGQFITFEGIDGVGKTTQARKLVEAFRRFGRDICHTWEPGGTALGQAVRQMLLEQAAASMAERTEILLYAADRAQHVQEVIAPALQRGAVVICERYIDSSLAYQGWGLGYDGRAVRDISLWAADGMMPNLTLYLDLPLDEAVKRTERDRITARNRTYYRRVREGYRHIAQAEPERVVVVSAAGSPCDVHRRVLDVVQRRLNLP